jgi:hypothetical protein
MNRTSFLREALMELLSDPKVYDDEFDRALTYSGRAMKGAMGLGAVGGLGVAGVRDAGGEDYDAGDYFDHAATGAAIPMIMLGEAGLFGALGPERWLDVNRRALNEIQIDTMRRALERQQTARRKRKRVPFSEGWR